MEGTSKTTPECLRAGLNQAEYSERNIKQFVGYGQSVDKVQEKREEMIETQLKKNLSPNYPVAPIESVITAGHPAVKATV